jgi:hypothetical protein
LAGLVKLRKVFDNQSLPFAIACSKGSIAKHPRCYYSQMRKPKPAVFEYKRRKLESVTMESSYPRFPSIIGAIIIAAAIVLSTLLQTALTRYVAVETPNEEAAWLLDRLTGNLYKCYASSPGKASCEADLATGSVSKDKNKR